MKTLRSPAPELLSLLEQMPGCRILMDADYRIVASNSCYRSHCKASCERDVVGRYCYEVSHGYDAPCDQHGESCPRRAVAATGAGSSCVHVHHSTQGAKIVEVEVLPLLDAEGRIAYYLEHMEPLYSPGATVACVGTSPAFLAALQLVKRVSATDTSVLLLGETGTGKEVLARAAHDLSLRAEKPFVVVDCAGLAETLFESELFGHEKGAFTGAVVRKPGLVDAAAGGTLFIDEIGDIPLAQQVKLLRLLETGLYRRVGGTDMQRADFRLIAATHRDLAQMVEQGSFRADLYYRVSAFPIVVPPLRERSGDLAQLARSILSRLEHGRSLEITPAALEALHGYAFPGNVRELRNILERASLLADGDWIDVRHLPANVAALHAPSAFATDVDHAEVLAATLEEAEHAALRRALAEHHGSRRELADRLGLSERTLYRKLRELADTEG